MRLTLYCGNILTHYYDVVKRFLQIFLIFFEDLSGIHNDKNQQLFLYKSDFSMYNGYAMKKQFQGGHHS